MNQAVILTLRNFFIKYFTLLYETNSISGFVQHSGM